MAQTTDTLRVTFTSYCWQDTDLLAQATKPQVIIFDGLFIQEEIIKLPPCLSIKRRHNTRTFSSMMEKSLGGSDTARERSFTPNIVIKASTCDDTWPYCPRRITSTYLCLEWTTACSVQPPIFYSFRLKAYDEECRCDWSCSGNKRVTYAVPSHTRLLDFSCMLQQCEE